MNLKELLDKIEEINAENSTWKRLYLERLIEGYIDAENGGDYEQGRYDGRQNALEEVIDYCESEDKERYQDIIDHCNWI